MSSTPSPRRRKEPAQAERAPMFELRHDPLPPPPRPLRIDHDLLDGLPDPRPRAPRPPITATEPRVDGPRRSMQADPPAPLPAPARQSLAGDIADLRHAGVLVDHIRRPPPSAYGAPAHRGRAMERPGGQPLLLLAVALLCAAIVWLSLAPAKTFISAYSGSGGSLAGKAPQPQNVPDGEHAVVGVPSINAELIDAVLARYGSPAQGTGRVWVELGNRYRIDPAYALAFFIHESSAGTNPVWAGLKPGGGSTHNVGNIICAGYPTCFGRFRDYGSWEEGIEDWYKLISREYIDGRGAQTVEQIIPIYAPASDNNNVPNYVGSVVGLVNSWRQGVIQ